MKRAITSIAFRAKAHGVRSLSLAASVLLAIPIQACGGGGGQASSTGGRAVVSIQWPSRSRLIPAASNSLQITFLQGAQSVATQTVARPASGGQSTLQFDNLPATNLTLTAAAFPAANATAVAQASGTTTVAIQDGKTASVSLTLDSTVDHLEVSPSSVSVFKGHTVDLTVTAKDAGNRIVLLSPSKIAWLSSDEATAMVSGSGTLTGVNVGPASITVSDAESGKSLTVPVGVGLASYITMFVTGHITDVSDPSGVLGGKAKVGDVVRTSYVFDNHLPGGNNTAIRSYVFYGAPYKLFTRVGNSLSFQTPDNGDPNSGYVFGILVTHGAYNHADEYWLTTTSSMTSNLASTGYSAGASLRLTDDTLTANGSLALPTTSIDVSKYFQRVNQVGGTGPNNAQFNITSTVDSMQVF